MYVQHTIIINYHHQFFYTLVLNKYLDLALSLSLSLFLSFSVILTFTYKFALRRENEQTSDLYFPSTWGEYYLKPFIFHGERRKKKLNEFCLIIMYERKSNTITDIKKVSYSVCSLGRRRRRREGSSDLLTVKIAAKRAALIYCHPSKKKIF